MDSDDRHVVDAQAAQSRCMFAASFDTVLHITNDSIKTLFERFNMYTLFDGVAYNTCGYFASCVVFFRARRGEEKYEQ